MTSITVGQNRLIACILYIGIALCFALQLKRLSAASLILPIICIGLIVTCTVLISLKPLQSDKEQMILARSELATIAFLVGYMLLISQVGFYLASGVLSAILLMYLSGPGKGNLIQAIIYGSVLVAAVYGLFAYLLNFILEPGALFILD